MKRVCLLVGLLVFIAVPLFGQPQDVLYQEIAKIDSLFFVAQNACDLPAYEAFLTEDFEGYHDVAGLTTPRDAEMDDMQIFCGEQRKRQPLRREMKEGTLEVYPLKDYGALGMGEHVFYLLVNDGTEKLVGHAKYTFIWKRTDDGWKIARSLSYDHQPLAEAEVSEETLRLYEGNYQATDRLVNVKKEGPGLRVSDIKEGEVVWSTQVLPQADNLFYFIYENVVVEFVMEGGEVVKHIYHVDGEIQEEVPRIEDD